GRPVSLPPLCCVDRAGPCRRGVSFLRLVSGSVPARDGLHRPYFHPRPGRFALPGPVCRSGHLAPHAGGALMTSPNRGPLKCIAWLVGLLIVFVGLPLYFVRYKLYREEPQHFDTPEERFKYGSIGNEAAEGLPYHVWRVLPRLFPEYLPGPGGYAAFGIVWEEGHETPVGFSLK